jgi:uracil-DNA glycosylase
MGHAFDEAISGIAATLNARLETYEDAGVTHIPHPRNVKPLAFHSAPDQQDQKGVKEQEVSQAQRLAHLEKSTLGICDRCDLHQTRTQIVFGAGNSNAELLFLGEGPVASDDREGIPFAGKPGELLSQMIKAMGFRLEDVYLSHLVKCRPPNDRAPSSEEIATCEPFLMSQIKIISPKVIVTLGRFASQTLLKSEQSLDELRGQWTSYEGIDVMPTLHPEFLLGTPARKRDAWHDLQQVMARLGKTSNSRRA